MPRGPLFSSHPVCINRPRNIDKSKKERKFEEKVQKMRKVVRNKEPYRAWAQRCYFRK